MKTYVLIVSTSFPKSHPKVGTSTFFLKSIKEGKKIHTIRKNYDLWEKRIQEVQNGTAILSIRYWTGLPYKSPQQEFTQITKEDMPGVEKVYHTPHGWYLNNNHQLDTWALANNDGLKEYHFESWFKDPSSEPLAIIHFSSFRYLK